MLEGHTYRFAYKVGNSRFFSRRFIIDTILKPALFDVDSRMTMVKWDEPDADHFIVEYEVNRDNPILVYVIAAAGPTLHLPFQEACMIGQRVHPKFACFAGFKKSCGD